MKKSSTSLGRTFADLDETDKRLLRCLQKEGRLSLKDLAEMTGVTSPTCLDRKRALERDGFITSYHAKLNPQLIDVGQLTYVFVELLGGQDIDEVLRKLKSSLMTVGEVLECHLTVNRSLILKVRTKNLEAYQDFISHTRWQTFNCRVSAHIVFDELKETSNLPI